MDFSHPLNTDPETIRRIMKIRALPELMKWVFLQNKIANDEVCLLYEMAQTSNITYAHAAEAKMITDRNKRRRWFRKKAAMIALVNKYAEYIDTYRNGDVFSLPIKVLPLEKLKNVGLLLFEEIELPEDTETFDDIFNCGSAEFWPKKSRPIFEEFLEDHQSPFDPSDALFEDFDDIEILDIQAYVKCTQCGAEANVDPMKDWLLVGVLPHLHTGWGHFEDGVGEYIFCSDACRTKFMSERPGKHPLQPLVVESTLQFKEPFPETRLVGKTN